MSSFGRYQACQVCGVREKVALMRRNSSQLAGHRQIEFDSDKTVDFSGRKSSVGKRMRIPDEPDGAYAM